MTNTMSSIQVYYERADYRAAVHVLTRGLGAQCSLQGVLIALVGIRSSEMSVGTILLMRSSSDKLGKRIMYVLTLVAVLAWFKEGDISVTCPGALRQTGRLGSIMTSG